VRPRLLTLALCKWPSVARSRSDMRTWTRQSVVAVLHDDRIHHRCGGGGRRGQGERAERDGQAKPPTLLALPGQRFRSLSHVVPDVRDFATNKFWHRAVVVGVSTQLFRRSASACDNPARLVRPNKDAVLCRASPGTQLALENGRLARRSNQFPEALTCIGSTSVVARSAADFGGRQWPRSQSRSRHSPTLRSIPPTGWDRPAPAIGRSQARGTITSTWPGLRSRPAPNMRSGSK
jgi:hypothetical protein